MTWTFQITIGRAAKDTKKLEERIKFLEEMWSACAGAGNCQDCERRDDCATDLEKEERTRKHGK